MSNKVKTTKKGKSDKSNLIIGLVGGAALLILLTIIILSEALPIMTGKGEFSARLEGVREAEITTLEIVDPSGTQQKQAIITSRTESDEIRNMLCAVADKCTYSEKMIAPNGHWDLRVRFHAGDKKYDFYLTQSTVYVTVNNDQYHFKPESGAASAFSELYSAVTAKLK